MHCCTAEVRTRRARLTAGRGSCQSFAEPDFRSGKFAEVRGCEDSSRAHAKHGIYQKRERRMIVPSENVVQRRPLNSKIRGGPCPILFKLSLTKLARGLKRSCNLQRSATIDSCLILSAGPLEWQGSCYYGGGKESEAEELLMEFFIVFPCRS